VVYRKRQSVHTSDQFFFYFPDFFWQFSRWQPDLWSGWVAQFGVTKLPYFFRIFLINERKVMAVLLKDSDLGFPRRYVFGFRDVWMESVDGVWQYGWWEETKLGFYDGNPNTTAAATNKT